MKTLKQNIKKSLLEVKENKRVLIIEKRIINNRFEILKESFEKDQNTDRFFYNIIKETIYLKEQNYDEKLLSEGLLDLLGGLFKYGGSGMIDTFQEFFIKAIIKGLGLDENSTWAIVIKNAFANVDVADLPKLVSLDCKYISNLIVRTTAETFIDKMKWFKEHDKFGTIVKNTLDSYFRNHFEDDLTRMVTGPICELLSGFQEKMKSEEGNIKKLAASAMSQGGVQPG